MPLNGVEILETMLRDGMQSPRVALGLNGEDILQAVRLVDNLRYADIIEAGFAGSDPVGDSRIKDVAQMGLHARVAAFGRVRFPNTQVDDYAANPGIKSLLDVQTPVVVLVYKSWDHQVRSVIKTTPEQNAKMLEDTVRFFVEAGKEVIVDAELATAAYLGDPREKIPPNIDYLLSTLKLASEAGASKLVVCDTTGILLPQHITPLLDKVAGAVGGISRVGFHAHKDHGHGDTLTYMAYLANAGHIQTSFVGLGERAGNASAVNLLGNLTSPYQQKPLQLDLTRLTPTANSVYFLLTGRELPRDTPFVGGDVFTHTAGMHADGNLKDRHAYNGRIPDEFGNQGGLHLSLGAGRSHFAMLLGLDKQDILVDRVYGASMQAIREGYDLNEDPDYLRLIVMRSREGFAPPFEVVQSDVSERVVGERLDDSAKLRVRIKGEFYSRTIAGQEGVVDATIRGLREMLAEHYHVPEWRTVSYKERGVGKGDTGQKVVAQVSIIISPNDKSPFMITMPGVSHSASEAAKRAYFHCLEYLLSKV